MDVPLPSPSASIRSNKHSIPLLSLAPPALALGDELAVGEPGDEKNAGEIWNVITRAADLVKDGERLENLAWRHWGQPGRRMNQDATRRLSMSSQATTASSASIHTPVDTSAIPFLHRSRSAEKLTFGGALRLLLEKDENNFKDWVEDAKRNLPPIPPNHRSYSQDYPEYPMPTISVPDTPVANVEIRLVEPTPVPSRVGSLGGSMNTSGLLHSTAVTSPAFTQDLKEEIVPIPEEERSQSTDDNAPQPKNHVRIISTPIGTPSRRASYSKSSASPKKKNSKFFVQSSPSKGSGSDSSHPSPSNPIHTSSAVAEAGPSTRPNNASLSPAQKHSRRRSSGDSSGLAGKANAHHGLGHGHGHGHAHAPHHKRHVSLSTMRGKYQAEKRRMAEQHSAMANENQNKDNEESGWEDEEEDLGEDEDGDDNWSDEEDSPKAKKAEQTEPQNHVSSDHAEKEKETAPSHAVNHAKPSLQRRRSSSRTRLGRTTSDDKHATGAGVDLLPLLTRKPSHSDKSQQHKDKGAPPPPAPTPLTKMSKKERQRAVAERQRIEEQLEAQRQREMFAKQQIFGSRHNQHNQGLLASALQRGASMVNLQSAVDTPSLRSSSTHAQLPSLASSPNPGPSLLRSKSVVAMPVQTGVSVTIPPHALDNIKEKKAQKAQKSSQEKAKASVEMESSSEEDSDADADYLNTTQTKQKLAALAAKRDAKTSNQSKAPPPLAPPVQTATQAQAHDTAPSQALPACPRVNEYGYVQPMSPTTRRRNIIMAEMSESLRRNVVLEREKSSGGGPRAMGMARPPPSKLSTHHSAINLTQYSRGGGGETMERTSSHPARASPNTSQPSSHTGAITTLPTSTSPAGRMLPPPPPPSLDTTRRRTTPNILGGNLLRPLTRATLAQPVAHPPQPPRPHRQTSTESQKEASLRNPSVTNSNPNSNNMIHHERSESPSPAPANGNDLEAPAMMRRVTDGDELHLHKERERRRELARRRDTTDTSYRLHGW
ncbi:uncharacterized protein I303_103575 [Kwoniella dejecticola CBS 10117]|uniref:Nitrogen regulatory protein areA GATA-like domain-containing protein n=1 Tax=Kwoniella dejecticola CBS 10117 TaxID=1296121 RepID=A0A1A6A754_9TREE|nr:uncharacterized protein I303_03597 [Kwoniella dejecticola CBS 10117]OBR85883.1 hypothetical protein I303_03597 [Kwoniella dejecticola CBS 10117]